jgi:hypothetical protein
MPGTSVMPPLGACTADDDVEHRATPAAKSSAVSRRADGGGMLS